MSGRGLLGLVVAVLLGWPALAAAQGLGDVAARAREEREKKPAAEKTEALVLTNDDLEGLSEKTNEESAGTVSTPTASGAAPAGPVRRSGPSRTPEQLRAARQQPFEARANAARTRVQTLEAQLENLQQRLNPMSTTYIYGATGGPVGGTQAAEEQRVRSQLTATEQQLAQARQELSAAETALAQAASGPAPAPPRAAVPSPSDPGNDRP